MTISEAYMIMRHSLAGIYSNTEAALISRYVFEDLIEKNIRSERYMSEVESQIFQKCLSRLLRHEPWQYICGKAEFYGLELIVTDAVLIPRPETEELVDLALQLLSEKSHGRILDIGTGSGAIIISLATRRPSAQCVGIDISQAALDIAGLNAESNQVTVELKCLDFLDNQLHVELGTFDLIVSNPPYIGTDESKSIAKNVLDFEPHIALFSEGDVLKFYKAIANFVMSNGNPGCHVMVEINERYSAEVSDIFSNSGLDEVKVLNDLQSKDRFVSGVKKQ